MSIQPPITKGIINAFDIFLGDLRKLLAVSSTAKFRPQIDSISSPAVFESAQRLFLNITEDSIEDDCLECMKAIQDLPSQPEFELEKVTSLTSKLFLGIVSSIGDV